MVFERLAAEAAENIGRESAVGQYALDGSDAVQVPCPVVLAVHLLEYTARTALHRQMQVVADVGVCGHGEQYLVGHVFGVGRREAYAHVGGGVGHNAEQVGKVGAFLSLFVAVPVAVDVLTEQGDFLESLAAQVGHLVENALHAAATFAATGIGDDAVGAEIVAAAHDADEARDAAVADARRDDVAVGLGCGELHVDGFLALLGSCDEVGKVEVRIRSGHEVGALRDEFFTHTFGHTSEHAYQQPPSGLFALGRLALVVERLEEAQA